jgi:hypothetical protein
LSLSNKKLVNTKPNEKKVRVLFKIKMESLLVRRIS